MERMSDKDGQRVLSRRRQKEERDSLFLMKLVINKCQLIQNIS